MLGGMLAGGLWKWEREGVHFGGGEGRGRGTSFVSAVVAGVAVCVVEEKGAEEGRDAEYGLGVVSVAEERVSISSSGCLAQFLFSQASQYSVQMQAGSFQNIEA